MALLGMLILSVTMYYSTYLASELEKKEVWQAELHALAVESFNDESNLDRDMPVEDRILDLDHQILSGVLVLGMSSCNKIPDNSSA
mgnify:CR=1 FL=1